MPASSPPVASIAGERCEEIARGLSERMKWAMLNTPPEALPDVSDIGVQIWRALYRRGLVSEIRAAGRFMFDFTDFGLAVREILQKEQPHGN
jgi:hypothetical protein